MDRYDDDVANRFITNGDRKAATDRVRLQNVERPINKFVFAPTQLFVGVVNKLMRHHTKRQEQNQKNVGRCHHRLTPSCFAIKLATHTNWNDNKAHQGRQHERKQECLVHSWPSENVNCEHYLRACLSPENLVLA